MIWLRNSFIVKDGIIFNHKGIFSESLVKPGIKWQYTGKFFLQQLVAGKWKVFFVSPILIIYDAWSGNIFHWLYDCLPRIINCSTKECKQAKLVLPASYKNKEFVQLTLPLFYNGDIEYIPDTPLVFSRKIIFAEKPLFSGTYNQIELKEIKSKLYLIKGSVFVGARIYISRQKSVYRRISNQNEVESLLKQKGFVSVFLEDYNFIDQLSILSKAEYVVAPHGAGLSHIIMMQERGKIIEIIPDSQPLNTCYQLLASALKLEHRFLVCKGVPGTNFQKDDIEVPLHLLEERLNVMLH